MSKITAEEVKPDDYVSFSCKALSYFQGDLSLKGLVRNVMNQQVDYKNYKYLELLTPDGIKGAYLNLTDEVVKSILSKEEQEQLVFRPKIRNLTRVVEQQGSDPEVFIVDKSGTVVPSFNFLKDKKNPDRAANNQPIFWDGFQAEFNLPADSCLDRTVSSTYTSLVALNNLAKAHNKDARLTIIPTLDIPPHMLRNSKEEHVQFGCMPSENVYGLKGFVADGRDVPFRSAGGHIHLQLNSAQKKKIPQYVKALDAILGVACVSMFGKFDDPRRRENYGLAGEYRTPRHGVEYRTLSNVWMCHPTAMYIVFELARKVISLVDAGLFDRWKFNEEDVISCINDCNIPLALEIIKTNEEMFKDILHSFCYQKKDNVDVVFATFVTGIENLITNVDDIEGNWNLKLGCVTTNGRIQLMREKNPNFKKLSEIEFE